MEGECCEVQFMLITITAQLVWEVIRIKDVIRFLFSHKHEYMRLLLNILEAV